MNEKTEIEQDTDRASIRSLTEQVERLTAQARHADREVYTYLRECEYLRTTLHRVRVAVDRGESLSVVRALVAETHLDMAGPRSSLRAGVEADAWAEYWQRAAEVACRERDEALAEQRQVLEVLDAALVDPDAPEDTGEGDDAGELVDAAEAVAARLRRAEAEVVRLATEVERLTAGEVPLPGAPALTAELVRCTWCHRLGHAADAHPLPKGHPQYDAFYDAGDAELSAMVPPMSTGGASC